METKINFYKNQIAINCLAKDITNAIDVNNALQGHACVGLLSSNFDSVEAAVLEVKKYLEVLPCVSVGLGAGNPSFSNMAALIAGETDAGHVNQTFPFAGFTAGYLQGREAHKTIINALVSPTGVLGKVRVATGVLSSQVADGIIDVESAIALILDMGAHSLKFFPMGGLKHIEEFKYICGVAANMGMELIEPTGGIDEHNLMPIMEAALNAGVKKCMPHIYTSIINKESGLTEIAKIEKIYKDIRTLLG
ncbi:MAG: KDGP aldolase [Alphaproteobacteria bacterium]|jgi:2-dehydro-3-deoxy-phosphogluconate aldolase|nr:KDGP aldolase [Alphaproteobacteria bacterium]